MPVPVAANSEGADFWNYASDSTLAQYLQYYNISAELIEEGETPTLKPDSRAQARRVLGMYTHNAPQ